MVLQNWMMSQGEENDQNSGAWNFTETDSGSALHGLLNPENHVPSLLTGRQCPVVPQQDHTLASSPTTEVYIIFNISIQPLNVSAVSSVQQR